MALRNRATKPTIAPTSRQQIENRAIADRVRRARLPRDDMPDDVCATAMRFGVIDEVEARAEARMWSDNVGYASACRAALADVLERIQEEAA